MEKARKQPLSVKKLALPTSAQPSQGAGIASKQTKIAPNKNLMMLLTVFVADFTVGFTQACMNIALKDVSEQFNIYLSVANWLVVGFTIFAAIGVIVSPAFMRRIGLDRLYYTSFILIALGSFLGVVASSFVILFIGRVLQAFATGLVFPASTAAIMDISPKEKIGVNLAILSSMVAVGGAISPLVSGLCLTNWGLWTVFIPPIITSLFTLVLSAFFVHPVEPRGHITIDALSIVLGFFAMAPLMFGLSELIRIPIVALAGILIGAIFTIFFVKRQFKLNEPLLDLHPLRHPRFTFGVGLVMAAMMAQYSMALLLPLYFEGALGYTAFMAGAFILGPILCDSVSAIVGGRIYDKHGTWPIVPVGAILSFLGIIGTFLAAHEGQLVLVILASCLVWTGVGFMVPTDKSAALSQLPTKLHASGSAINSTMVQIASAFGSSIFVGILSAVVVHEQANGVMKNVAYENGFDTALVVSMVIAAVAIVVSFIYSRNMRKTRLEEGQLTDSHSEEDTH